MSEAEKTDAPPPARRLRLLLSGFVFVAVLTLPCWGVPLFCFSFPTLEEWRHRVPFDPAVWKTTADRSARYDMSWDLVHGGVLEGKTPSEVEEALGQPMTTDTFGHAPLPKFTAPDFKPGVEMWYYSLGREKYEWTFGPSGAVLAVDFEGGKVVRVRKVVH